MNHNDTLMLIKYKFSLEKQVFQNDRITEA